jgi:hypothetical protein
MWWAATLSDGGSLQHVYKKFTKNFKINMYKWNKKYYNIFRKIKIIYLRRKII